MRHCTSSYQLVIASAVSSRFLPVSALIISISYFVDFMYEWFISGRVCISKSLRSWRPTGQIYALVERRGGMIGKHARSGHGFYRYIVGIHYRAE